MRFAVETLIGDEWTNEWRVDHEPLTFATRAEAEAELEEHLEACQNAYDAGHLGSLPSRDEFRIVEVDLMYRAVLTYHPNIGTFRGTRGAWRVVDCFPSDGAGRDVEVWSCSMHGTELAMRTARQLPKNTFANPTRLLREVLAQRSQSSQQRR
jgi:hypothetical protein